LHKGDATPRLTRLEFERSGRGCSHCPVSSASEGVYFKCVQVSLDIPQGSGGRLRYLPCAEL